MLSMNDIVGNGTDSYKQKCINLECLFFILFRSYFFHYFCRGK